ncbi:hypothetical protein CC2G_001862 [Coprinopsis cinerea AmutBmut pab1-1]|nr:hypothetical protein CC2G_001862 [Coprinopsis cinerea AmutBmut pab1-1]
MEALSLASLTCTELRKCALNSLLHVHSFIRVVHSSHSDCWSLFQGQERGGELQERTGEPEGEASSGIDRLVNNVSSSTTVSSSRLDLDNASLQDWGTDFEASVSVVVIRPRRYVQQGVTPRLAASQRVRDAGRLFGSTYTQYRAATLTTSTTTTSLDLTSPRLTLDKRPVTAGTRTSKRVTLQTTGNSPQPLGPSILLGVGFQTRDQNSATRGSIAEHTYRATKRLNSIATSQPLLLDLRRNHHYWIYVAKRIRHQQHGYITPTTRFFTSTTTAATSRIRLRLQKATSIKRNQDTDSRLDSRIRTLREIIKNGLRYTLYAWF